MSRFLATRNKGFRMGFDNGFEISVQWGPGNYCAKRDTDFGDPRKTEFWESLSAEIAVFGKDREFITITNSDVVAGWLTTDKVAKCITIVQSSTTKEEIETKLKALNI